MKKNHFPTYLYLVFSLLLPLILSGTTQQELIDTLLKKAVDYHEAGLHVDIVNPALAISNYNKALQIRKGVYYKYDVTTEEVLEGIIKGYNNIADCWQYMGNFKKMEIYLDSSLAVQLDFQNSFGFYRHRRRATYYHLLGQLYRTTAGLEPAVIALQNADNHYEQDKRMDPVFKRFEQAKIINDISTLLIKWGMEGDSVIFYGNRALDVYQSLVGSEEFHEDDLKGEMANAIINIGVGYEMNKDYKNAEQSFKKALQYLNEIRALVEQNINLYEEQNSEQKIQGEIDYFFYMGLSLDAAYNGLGLALIGNKKYNEAEASFNKAIKLNNRLQELQGQDFIRPKIRLAGDHHNLAELHYAKGNYPQAIAENQLAIDLIVKDAASVLDQYGNPNITSKQLYIYEDIFFLNALCGKTKSLRALGRHEEAIATAELGINYVYQIRSNYQDVSSRFELSGFIKVLTEELLTIYLGGEKPQIEKAFYCAERSKNYTLLEAVRDHKLVDVAGVDSGLLDRERKLRKAIDELKAGISDSRSATEKADLFQNLAVKKDSLDEVLRILGANPAYQKLYVGIEPVSISQVKKHLLAEDQILVEYFTGAAQTYIFVVPKQGAAQVYFVERSDEALAQDVDDFLTALKYTYQDKYEYGKDFPKHMTQEGFVQQWLTKSEHLFKNYLAQVVEDHPTERLVIIPDGPLNRLPFGALVRSDSGTIPGAYHTYKYAGAEYAFSYCYAATLLLEMQHPTAANTNSLLAFAPAFSGAHDGQKTDFPTLKLNIEEVENLCDRFSSILKPLIGEYASKQAFLDLIEASPYYVVHLSTHSKADYNDPNRSYISFSQLERGVTNKEQLFYLRELYNLKMKVEMVVLSSCEANVGPVHKAGGLVSLTRGFAFAGANSIISSMWAVNEKSTSKLMDAFYAHLQAGMPKDKALQAAKTSLLANSNYNHPYYWAAFIPVGKMADQPTGMPWLLIIGAGLIFLVGFFWWRSFR